MFFNIVCYCGTPVCHIYRFYTLAKLLNFQDQAENIKQAVQQILTEFSAELHDTIFEFIFVSFDHLNIYQTLDKQKAMRDLLKQYSLIYPYEDCQIPQQVQAAIVQSKGISAFFASIYTVIDRIRQHDVRRHSDANLVKGVIDQSGIKKQCCRQTILTFVDFYQSRDAFSSILH